MKLILIKNWDVILNRAKEHYENNKERLREQARNKYRCRKKYEETMWKKYISRYV